MKRDVMLFNLPAQTNWLMKGLWIAAGVIVIQVAVVTTLLLRHRVGGDGIAPAAHAAMMPVSAPAMNPPAPEAPPAVETPAQAPQQVAAEAPAPNVRQALPAPGSHPKKMMRSGGRMKNAMSRFDRSRGKGRRGGDRILARTSMGARKVAAPRSSRKVVNRNVGRGAKPDAIDQLLRNFK